MKKYLLSIFAACAAITLCAEEKVVAYWDFENGLTSGTYKMSKRGEAAVVDDAEQGKVLSPGKNRGKAGGIILASHGVPELQVAGPFELSMKIKYTMTEPAPKKVDFMYLWDSRYTKPSGMTVILRRSNTNKLVLSASIGDGSKVHTIIANAPANLADGKWHLLSLKLDANCKFTMALDGKVFRTGVIPTLPAPATQRLSIGDRVGSSYGLFPGLIDEVKLTAL